MTAYLKKPFDHADREALRINLSVRPDALRPEASCDWCGDPVPVAIYAASRLSTGEIPPDGQCWRWCACAKCERLIDHDNWTAIERKVVTRFKIAFGDKLARQFPGKPIPPSLFAEAVHESLQQFHRFAIKIDDDSHVNTFPGGGKTQ